MSWLLCLTSNCQTSFPFLWFYHTAGVLEINPLALPSKPRSKGYFTFAMKKAWTSTHYFFNRGPGKTYCTRYNDSSPRLCVRTTMLISCAIMKLTRFTVDKKSITLLLFPQCLELSADDGLQLNCKVKQKNQIHNTLMIFFQIKSLCPPTPYESDSHSHNPFC